MSNREPEWEPPLDDPEGDSALDAVGVLRGVPPPLFTLTDDDVLTEVELVKAGGRPDAPDYWVQALFARAAAIDGT